MTFYGERDGGDRPVLQIAMPRSPRIYALGGTMHVVARDNEPTRINETDFHMAAFHLARYIRAHAQGFGPKRPE